MSYFNEPARLAMLNIKNEIDKEEEMEKPIENKGLLSRTNPMSFKENNQKGKSEIEKVSIKIRTNNTTLSIDSICKKMIFIV